MPPTCIPAYVFFGATGAGKTSAIRTLLAQRTEGERWALLVNDFGRAGYEDATRVAERGVVVRKVSGCICCTAQVALRTALVGLVRAARPDRLLIEASSAAEPASIFRVLREPGIAASVALRSTIAVAHARQLADDRYLGSDVFRAQLAGADVIQLSGSANENERRAARAALVGIVGDETPVLERLGVLD
jgi:G3E family GTPase